MRPKFFKIPLYLFIFTLPLGLRHLIAAVVPAAGEYGSAFIYASDIFLILFLVSFALSFGWEFGQRPKLLIAFIVLSGVSVLFAASPPLAIYGFIRLMFLAWLGFAVVKAMKQGVLKQEEIFAAIAATTVFQALIAGGQFLKQGGLGLKWLGEPAIGQSLPGVAKIVVSGSKLVRAYGTFPHPNVLSAFLLIGLAALYYFWLRRPSEYKVFSSWATLLSDALVGVAIFTVLLGLVFAFSRVAWLAAALLTAAAVIYGIFSGNYFRQGVRLAILSLAILAALFLAFRPYILSRANIIADDPSVTLRATYNQMGLNLMEENLLGVGIGNQVVYSAANGVYGRFGLTESWQRQPIHNIYLLIGSEIGILGLLAWLLFLAKGLFSSRNFFGIAMAAALLFCGLFDHFLWTMQQGKLMLWLVIGIVLAGQEAS